MMNGAMAIFSSPVICNFGFIGSFIFTSTTPAMAMSGTIKTDAAIAIRFMTRLPSADDVPVDCRPAMVPEAA